MQQIFIIKNNKTSIGLTSKGSQYVVGFKHASIAKHVSNHIDINNNMLILKHSPIKMYEPTTKTELVIDNKATLFIPKLKNKEKLTNKLVVTEVDYNDFVIFPVTKSIGIIIPYIMLEDEQEFIYRSHVIDPII